MISSRRGDPEATLRERARVLAQPDDGSLAVPTAAFATFAIAGQALGVALERVTRALEVRHLTEVPGAPSYLLGITSVEGRLVSLIDVATLLEVKRRESGIVLGAVVVSHGSREIGLAAERLLGIRDIPLPELRPLLGAAGPISRSATIDGADLLLLDVESLFADARLARGSG